MNLIETDLLDKLEAVQLNFSAPVPEKEASIEEVITSCYACPEDDICNFILTCQSFSQKGFQRVVQIVEQYPKLYSNMLNSKYLRGILSLKVDDQTTNHIQSMLLIAITLVGGSGLQLVPAENERLIVGYALLELASYSLTISERASQILHVMIPVRLEDNFSLLSTEMNKHREDSTLFLRYLSLVTDICVVNENAIAAAHNHHLLKELFTQCLTDDILVQINALDLLIKLSNSAAGLQYISESNMIPWLVSKTCGNESTDEIPDELLGAETGRVLTAIFSNAAKHSHRFVDSIREPSVQAFLKFSLRRLTDGNEVEKVHALATVADFASISLSALRLVSTFQDGELIRRWMALTLSAKPELVAAALSGLVQIFDQTDEQYAQNDRRAVGSVFTAVEGAAQSTANDAQQIKKMLYRLLGETKSQSTAHYLLHAARQPIPVLRNAAMDLLRAIAGQPLGWGLLALCESGSSALMRRSEFFEYLTNRLTESSKEGKDFKFALIQTVLARAEGLLDEETLVAPLQLMVRQGAYYMPPRLEEMQTI